MSDLQVQVGNIQIDNLMHDQKPVIFCAKTLYPDLILNKKTAKRFSILEQKYKNILQLPLDDPILLAYAQEE